MYVLDENKYVLDGEKGKLNLVSPFILHCKETLL